ncbi:hypothetical protein F511_04032 [Dorcoceras hygrometricum]|uniref:Uncharacterized protein n=1 Tax=Dorcoceras hygrometricum TaxID=472368 RepID=A0A2Z7BCU9_9LAMI|nr:hypothetical protein F511_04032 [Dorcoceras hygrometricum]
MADFVASQLIHDLARHLEASSGVNMSDIIMSKVSVLTRLNRVLKHSHTNPLVVRNEETIRDLAYRIEDVIETCFVEVAVRVRKIEAESRKSLLTKIFTSLSHGSVLKNIKARIGELDSEIEKFKQISGIFDIGNAGDEPLLAATGGQRWLRQTHPRRNRKHFVGMGDELKKLVDLVVEKKTRVISIWGVTGLGKTTIARKIYDHSQVRESFEAFAWVCWEEGFQISNLLLKILRQLGPRKVNEAAQEETMINQLKEVQSQKNCLIVLDNIQDIGHWRQLSPAFEVERGHSVILLTTREGDVAYVEYPHELRLLDEYEGWDLLKQHAFPRNDVPDVGMFPTLGKEMVEKCGYLPSEISKLGRILSSKSTLVDWQMINNNISGYLHGQEIEGDEQLAIILDSIYDSLPYNLKQCFLYLGNFREDEEIDVEDLYFLWIAEGIVSSVNDQEEMTEDIANDEREKPALDMAQNYLTDLALREMVWMKRDELSATRRFQSCGLHSPARELCLWEGEKRGLRMEIIDFCSGKMPILDPASVRGKTRRLAIHFNQQAKSAKIDPHSMEHLRSLLFLNSDKKYLQLPLEISDFGNFKLLRVLKFVRCKFDGRKLPKGIDTLVNLRYLGLLYCDLDELPSSISNLRNLQILNIRVLEGQHLGFQDNIFNQLCYLSQLRLPYYTNRKHDQKLFLGNLPALETLFGFNSLIHDLTGLSLSKLRHLGAHVYNNDSLKHLLKFIKFNGARIRTNISVENKCDFTSQEGVAILEEVLLCPNLHALTLFTASLYKFPDCGKYVSPSLSELKLMGCKIKEDPMRALGKFPSLQKLCLGYGAFVGRKMSIQASSFPNLKNLEIHNLPYLEEWSLDEGAMPNLSSLIMRRCPKIKMIPDKLRFRHLKHMDVELAPEAFADVGEQAYLQNFYFVPSCKISIWYFKGLVNPEVKPPVVSDA